jgi:hypothetical protein
MKPPRVLLARFLALAAVATVAACGSSSPSSNLSSSAPTKVGVVLGHAPAGTVSLSWSATTKKITANFNMYGFTPDTSHAVHIHRGSCADQGNVVIPFPDISAGTGGAVKAGLTSSVTAPGGIPAGSYLNVHLAPAAQLGNPGSLGFTPIACADIPPGSSTSATLTMQALPQTGQHPSGAAKVSYDAATKTLTVLLTATGLAPSSAHAAHIHLGSCQTQGLVKYPLDTVTANASGSASVTTVVKNVASGPPASGWYVNLHRGSPSQIQSSGKPTLLFAPILCGNVPG